MKGIVMQLVIATSIVFALFACKRSDGDGAGASAAATAPPAAASAEPAAPGASAESAAARTVEPSQDVRSLLRVLEDEAANRPPTGIKVEQVFDALDRAGIEVVRRKQYLGKTVRASYCAGGRTARGGVPIAVCEYSDPKAAADGLRLVSTTLAKMSPTAKRSIKGSTTFSIAPTDPATQRDLVERATSTFMGL